MKLEEFNNLMQDYKNGNLRLPKCVVGKTEKELLENRQIFTVFVGKIIENPNREIFISTPMGKIIMKKFGVECVKNVAPRYGIYQSQTILGECKFFDAHRLFPTGQYPIWLKQERCFSNTLLFISIQKLNAKITSGIAYVGKPFLHSVIETENYVVDFNYNIVMSKDMYYKITNFEKLAEIDNSQIFSVVKNPKVWSNYTSDQIVFAYDDCVNGVENNKKHHNY